MNPYSNKVFAHFQFKDPETPQELMSHAPSGEKSPYPVNRVKPLIFLILLILILFISLLPWPTRIDLTLPGGRIGTDGELIQEGSVRLEGWQYNYLFRRDTMKVAVEVQDLTLSRTHWQKNPYYASMFGDYRHMFQMIHTAEADGYEISVVAIANDNSWCMVQIGKNLYYGSTNPEMPADAILQACKHVIY